MSDIQVMILCGGKGTRIRDVSEILPKPMLPIGERPVIWHIMKMYAHYGFQDFVLCLGYKGFQIKEFFMNYRAYTEDVAIHLKKGADGLDIRFLEPCVEDGWDIILAETGENRGTGARAKFASKYIAGDTFMLTYGDGVGNIDIPALLKFHRSHVKLVTVTGVRPPGRFGELKFVKGQVVEFSEKPQAGGGLINGGFFVMQKEFLDRYMDDTEELALELAPLQRCAADGELRVFKHDDFWQPMDTLREYNLLNDLWHAGDAPWKVWD
jgi:glucose-1-phosphate cytidylyltransferase